MTTRDLFELASLDVLGLLDEQERRDFEDAFRAAPPAVQAQVRQEQARFAQQDELLPEVHPPESLRARVLAAVREAVESVRTEPIARIGPTVHLRPGFSTAPLWRAACLGFATASIVLGLVAYNVNRINREIVVTALSNQVAGEVARNAGPGFIETVMEPDFGHVDFLPPVRDAQTKAFARLFVDRRSGSAYLVCNGLPISSGFYALVVSGVDGENDLVLKEFQASSGLVFVPISKAGAIDAPRLRIVAPRGAAGRGEVVLAGAPA